MKKTLMALAILAAAGGAAAQSSVTLFGIVDATLAHGSGSVSKKTQLANSGLNSSRLGFRGTEDLGGGMSASFWLEAAVANDSGLGGASNANNQAAGAALANGLQGLTFGRRSTISLAGKFGEVRLGRDFTPQFRSLDAYDAFGTSGVGSTQMLGSIITGVTAIRASNSLGYFLPANMGGFTGEFKYYLGENNSGAATSDDGKGMGLRLGYAAGPFSVALATGRTKYATGDVKQSNLGASWDLGVAKLMAAASRDENGLVEGSGYMVGATMGVGAGQIRLALSAYKNDTTGDPTTKKLAIGYVHNLSKRTAVYATYARVRNSGGAAVGLNGAVTAANESSNGYDIGLRHSF